MRRPLPALTALCCALAAPVAADAAPDTLGRTTLEQRVQAADPDAAFSFLRVEPTGDPYVVRETLARAEAGREERRRSLAYFAQLTDFQLTDEESPARVEDLDQVYEAFSSAWRPHEALLPHTVDASIRQVNAHLTSPVPQKSGSRARLGFAITTGDNADNQQRNESRWVATLLDGGRLDPNSGSADPAHYADNNCPPGAHALLAGEAPNYSGVQDYDDAAESGTYYDPDVPSGQYAAWPRWTGLMDRAQKPFHAAGLDVPSYVAFGNHDALVQGNEEANAAFDAFAVGCVKHMEPVVAPGDVARSFASTLLTSDPQNTMLVPPDPERGFVTQPEYRKIFSRGRQADGHGFAFVDSAELKASGGAASYYDFSPAPGLRFITLDSVANGGVAGVTDRGNIDDPQFQWLRRELKAAGKAGELVIVTSHHAPVSMTADVPDEAAGPCDGLNKGCDRDPRSSSPLHLGPELQELLLGYPNVIAWVAGHSHVNDVAPIVKPGKSSGYWIIRTSAEADFPHQDRLIEVMDNRDGTLSLFGTLLDNASPATAPAAGDAGGFDLDALASVGRTLGFNDPQRTTSAGGEPPDRNVELLLRDPRRAALRAKQTVPARKRIQVVPRRIRAGKRTRVRIRVLQGKRPVSRAVVRFADRRLRTGRRGRAVVRVKLARTGLVRVRAEGASAPVLVVRR